MCISIISVAKSRSPSPGGRGQGVDSPTPTTDADGGRTTTVTGISGTDKAQRTKVWTFQLPLNKIIITLTYMYTTYAMKIKTILN